MPYKGKGIELTRSGLADYLGVALTTVDRLVKDGCPALQRGGRGIEWRFNSSDVRRWELQRERERMSGADDTSDMEELKRRKLLAETTFAELDLAMKKKEVAPLWQMQRAMELKSTLIQVNLLNLPNRLEPQIVAESDGSRIKSIMRKEIRQVLADAAHAGAELFDRLLSADVTDEEFQDELSSIEGGTDDE